MNNSIQGLDLSQHNLNTSSSKQKFSFPKAQRFNTTRRLPCDSIYDIPSTTSRRSTSFGYGKKDIGIKDDKFVPPPATYTITSQFQEKKNRGFSFGGGRDQMIVTGPLSNEYVKRYVPGPGNYNTDYSTIQLKGKVPTIKSRLQDRTYAHLLKLPGPGAYNAQQIGSGNYYISSKHPNTTNRKISPQHVKLEPIHRSIDVGPGKYDTFQNDLNPKGIYKISKYRNSSSRYFDKSPRESIINKAQVKVPGPGQYFLQKIIKLLYFIINQLTLFLSNQQKIKDNDSIMSPYLYNISEFVKQNYYICTLFSQKIYEQLSVKIKKAFIAYNYIFIDFSQFFNIKLYILIYLIIEKKNTIKYSKFFNDSFQFRMYKLLGKDMIYLY